MIKKKWLTLCFVLLVCVQAQAQIGAGKGFELNARVTVNHSNVQGTGNEQVFKNLESQIAEFLNNRRWTEATFAINERIECTFTIIINEMPSETSFKGEIQIQARRPVYNSSYTTSLLNWRDTQFEFEYVDMEPLDFNTNTLTTNLTATLVFYIYTILGLDFDSYGLASGTPFYQQAQQIVNLAQSQPGWSGWKAFDSNRNRHTLITALTDNTSTMFREFWYNYHRKGLDEMAANADRGRMNIIGYLETLKELHKAKPMSALFQLFSDAKLDEVVVIYSKATTGEKQEGYTLLSNIYPGLTTRLEAMKK